MAKIHVLKVIYVHLSGYLSDGYWQLAIQSHFRPQNLGSNIWKWIPENEGKSII